MAELTQRFYAHIKHTIAANKQNKINADLNCKGPYDTGNRSAQSKSTQSKQLRFSLQKFKLFCSERRFLLAGISLSILISSSLLLHNDLQTKRLNKPLTSNSTQTIGSTPVSIQINHQNIVAVKNVQDANKVLKRIEQFYSKNQAETSHISINDKIQIIPLASTDDTAVKSVTEAVHVLLRGADIPQKYVVSRGDTLWDIAQKKNISIDKLVNLNPGLQDINSLQLGQELVVTNTEPYVHVRVEQTVIKDVTVPYTTQYVDDDSMASGDTKVVQQGQNGLETQTIHTVSVSGKLEKQDILSRVVKIPMVQAVVKRGTNTGIASGDYIWPISSHLITSPYGENRGYEFHPGVDIGAPTGTPIWASNNGTVIAAGWDDGGYGNCVRIDHGNGVVTIYGHMSRVDVTVGQRVSKGQNIGAVGSTGEATGPHLHYEVHLNGVRVDPSPYM